MVGSGAAAELHSIENINRYKFVILNNPTCCSLLESVYKEEKQPNPLNKEIITFVTHTQLLLYIIIYKWSSSLSSSYIKYIRKE